MRLSTYTLTWKRIRSHATGNEVTRAKSSQKAQRFAVKNLFISFVPCVKKYTLVPSPRT